MEEDGGTARSRARTAMPLQGPRSRRRLARSGSNAGLQQRRPLTPASVSRMRPTPTNFKRRRQMPTELQPGAQRPRPGPASKAVYEVSRCCRALPAVLGA
eukprot:15458507-Alexandrium_andersonii.AAC.1